MGDIVKRIYAVAPACAAPCQEGCGNEAASEMAHLRARKAVAGMLLLWALLFLLATLASFALPGQRAWADDGICGYAYLEPNADDPSMYTLVIQKRPRTDSGAYRELGQVPRSLPEDERFPWQCLPWHDFREKVQVASVRGGVDPSSIQQWFAWCAHMTTADLSGLDASLLTNATEVFYLCESLTSADLSGLVGPNDLNVSGMFEGCSRLSQIKTTDGVLHASDTSHMFRYCKSLASVPASFLDTSRAINLSGMFQASGITEVDLSSLDFSQAVDVTEMFDSCVRLSHVECADVNAPNLEKMGRMFYNCKLLRSIDLSGLKAPRVTDVTELFKWCTVLSSAHIFKFDDSAGVKLDGLFFECPLLEDVSFSSEGSVGVASMVDVFNGCLSLRNLDLSSFTVAGSVEAPTAFRYCDLDTVKLGKGFSSVGALEGLFASGKTWILRADAEKRFQAPDELQSFLFSAEEATAFYSEWIGSGAFATMRPSSNTLFLRNQKGDLEEGDVALGFASADYLLWEPWRPSIDRVVIEEKIKPAITKRWFNISSLEEIVNLEYLDTSEVENMSYMFAGCSLASVDPSCLDFSRATDLSGLLAGCRGADAVSFANVDLPSAENLSGMFKGFAEVRRLDISNMKAPRASNLAGMFAWCYSLSELQMSGFEAPCATNINAMFDTCKSLNSVSFDNVRLGKIDDMGYLFRGCVSLRSAELANLDFAALKITEGAFSGCASLDAIDLNDFDFSNVVDMGGMFGGCVSLTAVDLSGRDFPEAEEIGGLFSGCSSLESVNLSNVSVPKALGVSYLFSNCSSLQTIDLTGFDAPRVRDAFDACKGCAMLKAIDISPLKSLNRSFTTDMFKDCPELAQITIAADMQALPEFPAGMWSAAGERAAYRYDEVPGGVDATYEKVADKPYFHALLSADGTLSIGAQPAEANSGERLYQLLDEGYASAADVPWHDRANDVSFVEVGAGVRPASVAHWFEGCTALASADLSGLDTSGVSDFSSMFYGCSSLEELDLSGVDTRAAASMRRMFHGCRALESVKFGDAFTFRGSAWSRLPGSELPSGAWQEVDAQGAAIDADRAYASDSIPSFKEAAYRKIDETRLGLTIESVRGDSAAGTAKYTVETQLVPVEGASTELEAVSDYTLDDNYKGVFTIGDTAKASSWKPLSNKTITSATVRSVASKNVTTIRIGPQVAKIKAKAFAASPNVTRLEVQSDKLTTRGSVNNCLFKSKVSTVSYDSRMKKRLKVKYAFEHYAGKKVK